MLMTMMIMKMIMIIMFNAYITLFTSRYDQKRVIVTRQ